VSTAPAPDDAVAILGIPGSLRRGSFNRAALRAAQALLPPGATLEVFDLTGIPVFDQDTEAHLPRRVVELKAAVRAADAILFATPEYNFSIPGVLKNAIDWGSRPPGDSCWTGKPAAILGVSSGLLGTARAQYHLRQVLAGLDMKLLNKPEVMIPSAARAFDADGRLTDERALGLIPQELQALMAWTRQLRRGVP
jgi:chromate reductase